MILDNDMGYLTHDMEIMTNDIAYIWVIFTVDDLRKYSRHGACGLGNNIVI
jgi:hypothetical protein